MSVTLVLLHSPLVNSDTWQVLAPALRKRGYKIVAPDYSEVLLGSPPYFSKIVSEVLNQTRKANREERTILVGHSGAGSLMPAIAELGSIPDLIFMDALLPHPGKSWFDIAPTELSLQLRGLASNGRVPAWYLWWPKGAIQKLLGSEEIYEHFVGRLHDLPVAYFEEDVPASGDWKNKRCAYLQLSAAYQSEAHQAEEMKWSVTRLALNHLAMLTHSREVANMLDEIVFEAGFSTA